MGVGLCPALAVSRTVKSGLAMAAATVSVLVASGFLTAVLDRAVPDGVRFYFRMAVIAGLVTAVDLFLTHYSPGVRADLGIFVPLIAVNCMVIGGLGGRGGHDRLALVLGDLGRGLGFAIALGALSALRELVGTGALWGRPILGDGPVACAALPAGAFLAAGLLAAAVGLAQSRRTRRV